MAAHFQEIKNPVMRASAYINLYENMLAGQGLTPSELLQIFINALPTEPEELNLGMIAGHVSEIFWRLLKPGERQMLSTELEQKIWAAMLNTEAANKRKILFRTYQSIALTPDALAQLYKIWNEKKSTKSDSFFSICSFCAYLDFVWRRPALNNCGLLLRHHIGNKTSIIIQNHQNEITY